MYRRREVERCFHRACTGRDLYRTVNCHPALAAGPPVQPGEGAERDRVPKGGRAAVVLTAQPQGTDQGRGTARGLGKELRRAGQRGDIEGQGCRAGTSVYPTHPTPGFTCFGLPLAPTPRRGHDGTRGQPGPGADGGGWWRGAARCPQGQQHRDTRIWGSHGAGAGQHQHGGGSGTRPWRGTGWPTPALRGALVGPLGSPGASGTAPAPTAPTLPVSPVPAPRQRGGAGASRRPCCPFKAGASGVRFLPRKTNL